MADCRRDNGSNGNGNGSARQFPRKLWLYTNFHCNLRCSYCVAESTPAAAPHLLDPARARTLIDEARTLGFERVFLTGGEPLIINDIHALLQYAAARLPTTLLTNAMLLQGSRWRRLCSVQDEVGDRLTVQVSLDGATATAHDRFRGDGTWAKTVAGLRRLLDYGFTVSISTTETPANSEELEAIRDFCLALDIPENRQFVRPLARRGFAREGIDVGKDSLVPEITVSALGTYWHPLLSPSTDDMRISRDILPLLDAVRAVEAQLAQADQREEFT